MDPVQAFLNRRVLRKLRKFWRPGEEVQAAVRGTMGEPGVFLQTNRRLVWAPLKKPRKRALTQPVAPMQILRKDEKARIIIGDWSIGDIDRSRVANFVTAPPVRPQPKRKVVRKLVRKPSPSKARPVDAEVARSENARKARARVLFDEGRISKGEYEWMMR